MPFGVKVKLDVEIVGGDKLRSEIQKAVEDATRDTPIQIKRLSVNLNKDEVARVARQLENAVASQKVTIKIDKIDAAKPVSDLKKQLTTMLSGLSITGLKEFLGTDGVASTYEKAAAAADRLAEAQENVLKKTEQTNTALKAIQSLQSTLGSVFASFDKIGDSGKLKDYQKTYFELLAASEAAKNMTGQAQIDEVARIAETTIALKQQTNAQLEVERAAGKAGSTTRAAMKSISSIQEVLNKVFTSSLNIKDADKAAEYIKTYNELLAASESAKDMSEAAQTSEITRVTAATAALKQQVSAWLETENAASKANSATTAALKTLNFNQSMLRSALTSISKIEDKDKAAEYLLTYRELIAASEAARGMSEAAQAAEVKRITDATIALRQEIDAHRELEAAARKAGDVQRATAKLESVRTSALKIGDKDKAAEYLNTYNELMTAFEAAKNMSSEAQVAEVARISAATDALREQIDARRAQEAAEKRSINISRQAIQLRQSIIAWTENNTRAYRANRTEIDLILTSLQNEASVSDAALANLRTRFEEIAAKAQVSGVAGKSFFEKLKAGWERFGGWTLVTRSMTMAISTVKKMVGAVRTLDTAMTELKKVTDLTSQSYSNFAAGAAQTAKKVGASVSDTINATADFARLGFNIKDAAALAEAALIYKNVGDGIDDISIATESLISTIKAFGIESENSMRIVDMFNEVGNNFAISSNGIGEALKRSASSLAAAGNTIEQSIGLITAMNSVVQNPDAVGTSLKTLTMYLRAAKIEAEDAGIETEGMAESVSELRGKIMDLAGVDIMIDDDTFKSTYQIIKEIANVWADLKDVEQAAIQELIGGKRNANVVAALMTNFADAEAAMQSAMDSFGSATAENEKYLDSINGKLSVLKARFEELSSSIVNSSILKGLLVIPDILMSIATWLSKLNLLLPVTTGLVMTIRGALNGIKANKAIGDIASVFAEASKPENADKATNLATGAVKTALGGLSSAQKKLAAQQIESAIAASGMSDSLKEEAIAALRASSATQKLSKSMSSAGRGIGAALKSWQMWLFAIEVVITVVSLVIDNHNKKIQETIDKATELSDAYANASKSYSDNMNTLRSLEKEYNNLSVGVDENGKNVSLTADEYESFLNVVQRVIDISPGVVDGYTKEGRAIVDYTTLLSKATAEQEKFLLNQESMYMAGGKSIFEAAQEKNKEAYKTITDMADEMGYKLTELRRETIGRFASASDLNPYLDKIGERLGLKDARGLNNVDGVLNVGNLEDMIRLAEHRIEFLNALTLPKSDGGLGLAPESKLYSEINEVLIQFSQIDALLDESMSGLAEYMQRRAAWDESYQSWYDIIPSDAMDDFNDYIDNWVSHRSIYFTDLDELLDEMANVGEEFAASFSSDSMNGIFDIATRIKSGEIGIGEFNSAMQSYLDTLDEGAPLHALMLSYLSGLSNTLRTGAETAEIYASKVKSLPDSLTALTKGYDILAKAQEEVAKNSGLSGDIISSIVSMLTESEKITDFLIYENGLIKLNEDAWVKRNSALAEHNIGAIQKQIKQLEAEGGNILWGGDGNVWANAESEEYKKNLESIAELNNQLELYRAICAKIANGSRNPMDLSSMSSDLDSIGGKVKGLSSVLDDLDGGTAMSAEKFAALALQYNELLGMSSNYDLSSLEGQRAAIESIIDAYEKEYDVIIETRIAELETARDREGITEAEVAAINQKIARLAALKSLSVTGIYEEDNSKVASLSDIISNLQRGYELLANAQAELSKNGTLSVEMISSIASALTEGERITDYLIYENGLIKLNEEAWKKRSEAMAEQNVTALRNQIAELEAEGNSIFWNSEGDMSARMESPAYKENRAAIAALRAELELYQAIYNEIMNPPSDTTNLTSMISELDNIGNKAKGLLDALKELGNGAAMSEGQIAALALQYEELIGVSSDYDLSTLEGQRAAIESIVAAYEAEYDAIIEAKIAELEYQKNLAQFVEGSTEEEISDIETKITWLKSLMEALGISDIYSGATDNTSNALDKLSEAISGVGKASDLLTDIRSGSTDVLGMLSSAVDMARQSGKSLSEFFTVTDGEFIWNENGILAWVDGLIDEIKDLPGVTEEAIAAIKDLARAQAESISAQDALSSAIDGVKKASSLLTDIKSGEGNPLDMLQTVADILKDTDEYSFADFITGIDDLGNIDWNEEAIEKWAAAIVSSVPGIEELEKAFPGAIEYLQKFAKAELDASIEIEKFTTALDNVGKTLDFVSSLNSKDNDPLKMIQSAIELAGLIDGTDWTSWVTGFDASTGAIAWSDAALQSFMESVVDTIPNLNKLEETFPGITTYLKENALALTDTQLSYDKLSEAISGVGKASDLLTDIRSGSTDVLGMLSSAVDMARQSGKSLSEFFTVTDGEFIWNENGILAWVDGLIDEIKDLPGVTEEAIAAIKDLARAQAEVALAGERINTAYSGMQSAINSLNEYGRYTRITYENYQSLIEADYRYAEAVEYQNGIMVLNADKHDEITAKILEETRATAMAEKQAILMSDEYQKLLQRLNAGLLTESKDIDRLRDLEVQIKGYDLLAKEIDNATSAYYRWLNRKSDDGEDRYSQALKAYELIGETLNDKKSEFFGRVGREEFGLAVDFVLGEHVELNTPEFDRAMKLAKRYLTEGAEGAGNFFDDLVSNGLLDGTTGVLDSTVAEIAQTLGVSEEMVRTMIDRINEYQEESNKISVTEPEIDVDAEDTTTALEKVITSLESANEYIDTINETPLVISVQEGVVSSVLSSIIDKLSQIKANSSITVQINEVTTKTTKTPGSGLLSGVFGKSNVSGNAAVRGTSTAPGGMTLVGELGTETVVDPTTNTWYTVGERGAEFVRLPKNAIVFNHEQTADLFSNGRTDSHGSAYAAGNASAFTARIKESIASAVASVSSVKKEVSDSVNGSGITKPDDSSKGKGKGKGVSLEHLKEMYEELNKQTEHLIAHQEFLYKQAKKGLDYPGMEKSLQRQAELYKKIMSDSQEAVSKMIAAGADDTNEELQAMEEAYWSAYESLYGKLDEINALYVDALNEKIDGIQNAFDNLKTAADEFNEGGISVDTFQALVGNGLQYMNLLENINGQYVINTEGIQQMIAAQKEQLAIESALSYLQKLTTALNDKEANAVAALISMTETLSNSTWEAVYAQAALLRGTSGLTEAQYAKVIANIDAFKAIASSVNVDLASATNDAASDQIDALEKILDLTEDLIKAEADERIEAIEDEIEAYRKIIDLKKESLRISKEEDNYAKSVAEKTKEIANLQAKIDQLKLDSSREARFERAKLEAELAGLQSDLGELQREHSYDQQESALDKLSKDYEESRKQEIDAINNSISSAEKLYQAAIGRLSTKWDTLYDDLIAWNTEAGSSLNSEITENWLAAAEAVQRYGSYVRALGIIKQGQNSEDTTAHSNVVANGTPTVIPPAASLSQESATLSPLSPESESAPEPIKRVKVVDGRWNVRTGPSTRKTILGVVGKGDKLDYRGQTSGSWYAVVYNGQEAWIHNGGSKLIEEMPKYHSGGVAGNKATLKDNEVLSVLEEGELILTEKMKKAAYKLIDFKDYLEKKLGNAIGTLSAPTPRMPALAGIGSIGNSGVDIGQMNFSPTIQVEINHSGAMTDGDARQYGKAIADTALSEFYEGFRQRGIGKIFGSKPT